MPGPRSRATDLDRRGALRVLGHGLAGTVIAIWLVEHRARAQDIAVQTAAGPVQPPAVELGRDAIPAGLRVPDPSLPTLAPGTVETPPAMVTFSLIINSSKLKPRCRSIFISLGQS